VAVGPAYLGEGVFPLEMLCCSPSKATPRQTWNSENKKFDGRFSSQFLSTSLPFDLSHPIVNSRNNQTPVMFIRQLFCIF